MTKAISRPHCKANIDIPASLSSIVAPERSFIFVSLMLTLFFTIVMAGHRFRNADTPWFEFH